MTKFKPENHIIGKAYDLTQENMQAMLIHIDKLEEELDAALMALGLEQKEKARLHDASLENHLEYKRITRDIIKNLVDEREKMQVELANLRGVAQGLNDVVQGRTRKATSESTTTAIERAKDRVFSKRTKKARAALEGK